MAMHKMLINGSIVSSDKLFDVMNPATEEVLGQCPDCSKEQMDEAVAAAKEAFKTWKKTSHEERKAVVTAMIAKTNENMEALCEILIKEQGKPMSGAQFEIGGVGAFLGAFAEMKVEDKVIVDNEAEKVIEMHVPLGVVGGICPWNFPLLMAVWKIGEAMMTGNTIVIKTSPFTPLTTNMWGELVAGIIPAGVVNILSGGNDAGAWLTEHPDVAKISFTGSIRTGKIIQAAAASTLKRVTLELGGNDAAIVLDDADPAKVAPQILGHAMSNSGQVCIAVKRCYVPRAKYDEYIEEFKKAAAEHKVGDGFMEGCTMGPLNNKMQYDRVCELVEDAKQNGAKVEAGGSPLDRAGYFFPPTVLSNVASGMRIVDEEQFGPVLPVLPYDTEEEVIEKANDTLFGLGGSVWGEDVHAAAVARQIDSGSVWVNSHMNVSPDVSFGGRKCSGIGRQMGSSTIAGYTDIKVIRMPKPQGGNATGTDEE